MDEILDTKPIVVPWDYSPKAECALLHAVDFALALGRGIILVHITNDEADNASINTRELSEEADPTRTNELIRRILKSFTRSSYVGITATPFANVFIDPDTESKVVADDLFPRSFVYRLTTPSNYFGAGRLFAPGSPYLRLIDDIEIWLPSSHKKDDYPSDSLPLSLRTAIGYFLLVNGVMDVMGEAGDTVGHRSMMIHISRFIPIQNRLECLKIMVGLKRLN